MPGAAGGDQLDYGPSPKRRHLPGLWQRHLANQPERFGEVVLRFRELSPEDQQAVIEFLKQL